MGAALVQTSSSLILPNMNNIPMKVTRAYSEASRCKHWTIFSVNFYYALTW